MWSHNAFIYSIINARTNTPNALCNHKLSLTEFFRFASFFLPLRSILRGDLQVCTAIQSHRHKADGYGGKDFGEDGGHEEVSCCSVSLRLRYHQR